MTARVFPLPRICEWCGLSYDRRPEQSPSNFSISRTCSVACKYARTVAIRAELRAPLSIDALFDRSIPEPNSGCWLWLGATKHGPTGYGDISVNGKHKIVTRIVWELRNTPIPEGLFICHRCDVPLCINPDHLFLGTAQENFDDMRIKKRHPRGECSGMAKLTEKQVFLILSDRRRLTIIAREYGVSNVLISKIKRREIWTHLEGCAVHFGRSNKLTVESVREIYVANGRHKDIGARYGVSQVMVSKIKRGEAWIEATADLMAMLNGAPDRMDEAA